MSVLIKGMEMPESCFQCWFLHVINPGYFYCFASGEEFEENFAMIKGRYADCPLVEVPTPHGRLIDADALRREMYHKAFETDSDMQKWESGCWIRYMMFERIEEAAPTVIEAEGNDEDCPLVEAQGKCDGSKYDSAEFFSAERNRK